MSETKTNFKATVSVIIPTYNRYKYLLNAVKSVRAQTYPQHLITIIIIDDNSTDKEYKDLTALGEVVVSLGDRSSRKVLGYGNPGYVRNFGLRLASTDYIAFLDDDDLWLPDKLEKQITALSASKAKMCCTDGYLGSGIYDSNKKYDKFNGQRHKDFILGKLGLTSLGYPKEIDLALIKKHNIIISSSVIMETELANKVGPMICKKSQTEAEDYDYWLRCLALTNCLYLEDILFYYDEGHAQGSQYA